MSIRPKLKHKKQTKKKQLRDYLALAFILCKNAQNTV